MSPVVYVVFLIENMNREEDIKKAVDVLKKGGVILYPTDTVWGIGCDATNAEAVKRVYEIKQRDDSKAMICLVDSDARLQRYVRNVPDVAWQLIDSLKDAATIPNGSPSGVKPTTLILDGAVNLAPNLIAEDGSIALRITQEAFSKELCFRFIIEQVDYVCWSRRQEHKPHTPSSIIRLRPNGEVTIIRS